jgi:5-hydroxyisourate hydrolase-like protein (transthyretin family)
MMGVALAQEPKTETPANNGVATWLILDSAQPVEAVLPPLLDSLNALKAAGLVIDFDPNPQRSAPTAVPGVRVVAEPENLADLRRLPGVLDINATLPPPPPSGVGLLGTSGTITGRVTDAGSSAPLTDTFSVEAYDAVSFAFLNSDNTDSNGFYELTVTAPYSQVKIFFDISGYLEEWHNNKPFFSEATVIPLAEGSTITNVNGALDLGGAISGTVTYDGGGLADGINVILYDLDNDFVTSDFISGNGQFLLRGIPTGSYKLNFFGDIIEEWYQDQTSFETATPISVTVGQTETITAQVNRGGILTGVVTDTTTGLPLSFVQVELFDEADEEVDSDFTNFGDGAYTIAGLATGNYRVKFSQTGYLTEYHNNQATLAAANPVSVTLGQTTTVNAGLTPVTDLITGTVTVSGGTPLAFGQNVSINVYEADTGDFSNSNFLFGDGSTTQYSVLVSPGSYKVEFNPFGSGGLQSEFYDNKPTLATADIITVTAGVTVTDINADLSTGTIVAGSCITGTLTSNGAPLTNLSFADDLEVSAYDPADSIRVGSTDSTDANGVYQICDLEPGTYLVSFSKFPSATTWYNGQLSRATATTVTVTAGNTTPDIDGALDDLGACISGKIVDSGGQGIPGADFQVYDAAGNRIYFWEGLFGTGFTRSGDADADGGFVACGLAAGTYTIQATGDLGGVSGPVTVTTGETVGNITVTAARRLYLPIILK